MKIIHRLLLCSVMLAGVASFARAETAEDSYANKLAERVSRIVATLKVDDAGISNRVHSIIVAQYKRVNTWHEINDVRLKELKKVSASGDAQKTGEARAEIESINASLKNVHDRFIEELSRELSTEQIERVKDGMTAGKVEFTYKGYLLEYPAMNDEQKARVLAFLKEAREEAMDAGSMDEKSNIFNRYKGKINNWLSKQGLESKKAAEKKNTDKK